MVRELAEPALVDALVTPLEGVEAVFQVALNLLQVLAQALVRLLPSVLFLLLLHHLWNSLGHHDGMGVL